MNIFAMTDSYCQTLDWKKLSLFKLCCIAFGVVLGLLVPEKHKKSVLIASLVLFLTSYVPLMVGFIKNTLKDSR